MALAERIAINAWEELTGGVATPPFRADHVGSLLGPVELLRARAEHQAGRLSATGLRPVEE